MEYVYVLMVVEAFISEGFSLVYFPGLDGHVCFYFVFTETVHCPAYTQTVYHRVK